MGVRIPSDTGVRGALVTFRNDDETQNHTEIKLDVHDLLCIRRRRNPSFMRLNGLVEYRTSSKFRIPYKALTKKKDKGAIQPDQ